MDAQERRGPDSQAVLDLEFASIGVTRLAISGLSNGDQPFGSPDGQVLAIFNGALYNAGELVESLALQPRSTNDGEVIPELYNRYGLAFADELEGMFAICIADRRNRRLVIAVDEIGIKPLYWYRYGGEFMISSTLQAFPPSYLSRVERVPPGVVWASSGESRRIRRGVYSDGDLGELLVKSVEEQLPREVPWGCLLSGGVDSSLVTKMAVSAVGEVRTFTCGTQGSSDLIAARTVAEMLGTEHTEMVIDPAQLPPVVEAVVRETCSFERFTVMGGVGTYLAAEAAQAAGVKVLLSGEGADELFAGYDEFVDVPDSHLNGALLQAQVDLGATECLRLDRCTMAHSIEARVPFLSTSVIRAARGLPASAKLRRSSTGIVRKAVLRDCAKEWLPTSVAMREKVELKQGSGVADSLAKVAKELVTVKDVADLRAAYPSFPIDDELSAWFFRIWWDVIGHRLAGDWNQLVGRGIFRQPSNVYLPNVDDNFLYGVEDKHDCK